jgi:TRAP-type C4-dicarboxylate transport system substrate-binding protein
MKKLLSVICGATAIVAVASTGANAEAVKLKFAVFTPENEVTYQTIMKPWAERVMRDAKGLVEIKMYPGGTLGRDGSKQIKLLKDGVADIAFIIMAYNPGLFPDDKVTELPNLINNAVEGSVAFWRLHQKGLLRGYEELEVFSLVTTSPYLIHANRPIKKTADLRGLKIRSAGKLESDCITALGAVPVGMPVGSVAESLSRGVIDATPMHYAALHAFGIAGATKYHYENRLGAIPFGFVMTKERFAQMPAPVQQAMRKNGGEVLSREFGKAMDAENARLRKATEADEKQSIVVPSDADRAAWDKAVGACRQAWMKDHPGGQKLLDTMRAEIAAVRGE